MTCCVNCREPVVTPQGVIDLNAQGECEDCQNRRELANVIAADSLRELDFDYSMNG